MYSLLARYYDLENAAFTDDFPFWLALAREQGGPVLEIGCGSGRVLFQLARDGHTVTGLDNSPAMLALARARLAKRRDLPALTLVEADMRDFTLDSKFNTFIVPFNTFAHLLTQPDQLAALDSFRRHAEPGALLTLDLPNAAAIYASGDLPFTLERSFRDDERNVTIQQFSTLDLHRAEQLGHVTWLYDEIAADGSVKRTTVPVAFRYTFPAEIELLLLRAGWELDNLFGDYDESLLSDDSPRMLVLAHAM